MTILLLNLNYLIIRIIITLRRFQNSKNKPEVGNFAIPSLSLKSVVNEFTASFTLTILIASS